MKERAELPEHLERLNWQGTEGAVLFNVVGQTALHVSEQRFSPEEVARHSEHKPHDFDSDFTGITLAREVSEAVAGNAIGWVEGQVKRHGVVMPMGLADRLSDFTSMGYSFDQNPEIGFSQQMAESFNTVTHGALNFLEMCYVAHQDRTGEVLTVTLDDVIADLRSGWFKDLIEEATKTHNSFWETFSTVSSLGTENTRGNFVHNVSRHLSDQEKQRLNGYLVTTFLEPAAERDSPRATVMSNFAKEALNGYLRRRNNQALAEASEAPSRGSVRSNTSGGCPVMHTYVEFADDSTAMKEVAVFLRQLGIGFDVTQEVHFERTAIDVGLEVLANCCERYALLIGEREVAVAS